jgi:hypothetical protein
VIRAVAVYGIEVPRWEVRSLINSLVLWKGKSMTTIVTIGIDLAKNVFAAVLNNMTSFVRKGLTLFSAFATAGGLDQLGASIEGISKSLEVGYEDISSATATAQSSAGPVSSDVLTFME